MKKLIIYIVFILINFSLFNCSFSDKYSSSNTIDSIPRSDYRLMFYNVENFYDTIDDPLTDDNEFLPTSARRWNSGRYWTKVKRIYKVISSVGGWEAPEIIGFCEIENKQVIEDICYHSPLSKYMYGIVHKDSPDARGIDVALIFRTDKLKLLHSQFIKIIFSEDSSSKTRDILYACLKTKNNDSLHIFVNHFPSRRGGASESEIRRIDVAKILRSKIDSILNLSNDAKIIVMGDFNDEPNNISISKYLYAIEDTGVDKQALINKMALYKKQQKGSYKYKSEWNLLDQFMVSSFLKRSKAYIYEADFLLEIDEENSGFKPFKLYSTPFKYNNGYSDHLPIFMDLYFEK